jgi:hypothetical protein
MYELLSRYVPADDIEHAFHKVGMWERGAPGAHKPGDDNPLMQWARKRARMMLMGGPSK